MLRRMTTATRWPVGIVLTSWRYMWRTTPLYRSEEEGSWDDDAPPRLPDDVSHEDIQRVGHGAGPMFRRRYTAVIADSEFLPEGLMERLTADLDRAAPTEFATFKKLEGETGDMQVGDEYVVRMPGPWDGPVRVVERTPTAFRLATLDGHLEAGQIRFSAERIEDRLQFQIESWARGGDRLSNLLYDNLRMSKEIQFHMWTSFLEGVIDLSGGKRAEGLRIHTRRVEDLPHEELEAAAEEVTRGNRRLGDPRSLEALQALHDKPLNFDLAERARFTPEAGWHIDNYRQPLPSEAPGPPEPDGIWEQAKQLMLDYEFADPKIVTAVYAEDSELEGRDMLLEARFWNLIRFRFGVRVGGIVDQTCEQDGREARIWGWSYRTLQDHLEMGQMDYQVWKWTDTGEVEFRIHVVSQPASVPNPIVRLGFRLFGRREQIRFARRACERMASLLAGDQVNRAGDAVKVREKATV
jgi:uncharacterized protein (UPF0548 family)